jgi:dihydrofolate synthase/folylpolyglutamate synthase
MGDKDSDAMLAALAPFVRHIVFTRPAIGRARDPVELARRHGGEVVEDVAEAVARARRCAGRRGTVLVTGSIYTVAEARAALLGASARAEPHV